MSLKSIVEYRRHVEDMAREELAAITAQFAVQLNAARHLEGELQRVLDQIDNGKRGGFPIEEAVAIYRHAEALSADLATARRLAASLNAQKEAKQASLMSAARDSRVVQKLDARRDRERLRLEDRKEQQSNDEASLRRWLDLSTRSEWSGEKSEKS
jgi:flagellar export protein FliJ